MFALFRRLAPCLACLVAFASLSACANQSERGPVVLAAASLQEAMEEVADAWAEQGHARPVLSFAGTSALARQIEAGAPADIFVSADEEWMDEMERQNLLRTGSRAGLLANRLVLVGARGWGRGRWEPPGSLAELSRGTRVAVADTEAVPAGRYTRSALESLDEWEALEQWLVPAENVRAALALVERGETELGIVYATDLAASEKVVLVGSFPEGTVPPIVYPGAILAGSEHEDNAAFFDFLQSAEAGAVFRSRGFVPLS